MRAQNISAWTIAQSLHDSHPGDKGNLDVWCAIADAMTAVLSAKYGEKFNSLVFERACVRGPAFTP